MANSMHRREHFEIRWVVHYLEGFLVWARKHFLKFLCLSLLVPACSCTYIGGNDTRCRSANEDTWRDLLVGQLKAAEESVDVAVHGFNDREFADCLIQVHRRGIRVRLYMDKAQMVKRVKPRTELGESGIPIRFSSEPGEIGENFCIIDGQRVIRGFPDWIQGLSMRYAHGAAISKEEKTIRTYRDTFENLWNLHFSIIYPYRF